MYSGSPDLTSKAKIVWGRALKIGVLYCFNKKIFLIYLTLLILNFDKTRFFFQFLEYEGG